MKKFVSLAIVLFLSFGLVNGQEIKSIGNIIKDLKSQRGLKKSNYHPNILIDELFCSHEFQNYEWLKVDENNFRIISNEIDYTLQLTSVNGQIKGFVLNEKENFGYKIINETGKLSKVKKEKLIYICPNVADKGHEHRMLKKDERVYDFGNADQITDPLLLESKPGAPHLIYLDFDGEATLPGWSAGYIATNANIPQEIKVQMWEAVSEDFLPFDVNVTNNRTLFDNHPELNKTWLVIAEFGHVQWGGLASIDSYGTGRPALVDVPQNYEAENLPFFFNSASHEIGHTLGLSHDDGGAIGYYSGHGEYTPIMGNGNRTVSHWSKGSYPGGTNHEDDIQLIENWIGNTPDEFINSKNLIVTGTTVDPLNNFGAIQTKNDVDTFKIVLNEEGNIRLKVSSPLGLRGNLDAKLTLLSSNKTTVISTSSPVLDRSGYVDEALNAGIYYLIVDGGSELSTSDGWDDYGSLGYYEISGYVGYIAPICEFSLEKNAACLNENVVIQNTSFGSNLIYNWTVSQSNYTNTNQTPSLAFATSGNKTVSLTVSNNAGSTTCTQLVKVGDKDIRITLPKNKLNENLKVKIKHNTTLLNSLTYSEFNALNNDEISADVCLFDDCYDVVLTDVFEPETCGAEAWVDNKAYKSAGIEVVYLGKIYRTQWYVNAGVLPTSSNSGWQYIGLCEITDETTLIKITSLTDNQKLFQTHPKEVGVDLDFEGNFCVGTPTLINIMTEEPTNCKDVTIQTSTTGNSIIWDFGIDATPKTAIGIGPHNVNYVTAGQKSITLTVDGVSTSETVDITDAQVMPTITIQTSQTTICGNDQVDFTISSQSNEGTNPSYEWFAGTTSVGTGTTYSSTTLTDGDKIQVVLTSSEACASGTAASNEVTMNVSNSVTPTIAIQASETTICGNGQVDFTIASQSNEGTNPSYEWFVSSTSVGTGTTYSSTSLTDGDKVKVVLTSDANCVSTSTATSNEVTMNVSNSVTPTIDIQASETTICGNGQVDFTIASQSNEGTNPSYEWFVGLTSVGTGTTYSSTNLADGDKVNVVLTSNASCLSTTIATSNEVLISLDNNCQTTPIITISTQNPDNCNDVVFETASIGNVILWDFGITANPSLVYGAGPHNVVFSTVGINSITLTIDDVETTKDVNITDAQTTPTLSVSTTNSTNCIGAEVEFLSQITNGGNNPTIEWYINNDLIEENPSFTTTNLENNDVVKAILTSDEACLKTETAESNNIEVTVEDCVSGISNKSIEAIHIYPNPANERLFIKTTEPVKFTIFNTTGIKVLTGTYAENGIDITNLQAGFYIIQIGNNTTKLIIE